MPTKLDRLLQSIDPCHTYDKVSIRVDEAVNAFAERRAFITDWNEYEKLLADFFRHIETVVLRMRPGVPENRDFYWGRCSSLLRDAFGPNGFRVAFELVRTGRDGGLYRVLKEIADRMAKMYAQNEISGRVSHYWESLNLDEKLSAPDEYLRKYGHLLPPELTEGSAARIRANFPAFLKEHPKTLRRLRRVGR